MKVDNLQTGRFFVAPDVKNHVEQMIDLQDQFSECSISTLKHSPHLF